MARLSDADQGRFPLPRLDSGGADRARSSAVYGSCAAYAGVATAGNSGMVKLLLQVPDDRARALSRARSVHPVDEAEEHAAALEGRGADYAFGVGVLRLRFCGADILARPVALPQRPNERTSPDP